MARGEEEKGALVIGVGNDWRGDDGVGRIVAQHIAAMHLPNVRVLEADGEGTNLIELWEASHDVFLVDAARSGGPPGTIFRFDASRRSLPAQAGGRTTHSFGMAEAIELSRSLGTLPARLIVFAIEGQTFETGAEMSVPVRRSADEVVRRITAEIRSA